MKSNLPNTGIGLSAHKRIAETMVWLGSDTAIAAFEDDGSLSEHAALNMLSTDEQSKAHTIIDHGDRRNFVFRRCFQRLFLKEVTQWPGALADLNLTHARDTRPFTTVYPHYSLSFSSSDNISIAAASRVSYIGVDIERLRPVGNSLELATRFFQSSEVAYLATVPESELDIEFLRFWTIKEACLKAIGKGIIYGLDRFAVSVRDDRYHILPPSEFGVGNNWQLVFPDAPANYVLVLVHNTLS
jgi:4'-phosphopantetheinyl transferase